MFRRISPILLASIVITLLPQVCNAGDGAVFLSDLIYDRIIYQALVAFWGVAAAFLLYYSIRMIMDAQKESALTDARQSFIYAFWGFAVLASATTFVSAFTLGGSAASLAPALSSVANYLFKIAEGVFVLMVTIAGFGMAMTQGDQGSFDKWRKVLLASCAGVVVMVLASTAVSGNSVIATAINTTGSGGAALIIAELVGLANFILTIFGFACAVALIVAGVMLIVSVDETLKDKAKKTIIGTLITLAIVLAIGALLNTFVLGNA